MHCGQWKNLVLMDGVLIPMLTTILEFMNRCNKALTDEYPKITIFGETWFHGVPNQAYFVQNNLNIPFKSNLQGATDFQTLWGIQDAMTKDFGWNDGVNKLYTTSGAGLFV